MVAEETIINLRQRTWKWGVKPRLGSLWIGAHWSPFNKRLCINFVPCVTLWITLPGGITPDKHAPTT
jgi:hypothetical protein